MAKTKQFKTESKKLLDLMVHSIYTHKEIFLRELISNASDAIDKRHYIALTDADKADEYEIFLEFDKDKRTITITDNGVGLTEEELINNLGTIAKSGSKEFQEGLDNADIEIIGQFGVGFYSAFMVSKKVTVITKSINSDQAYKWVSTGSASYTISESEKDDFGTTIILELRDNNDETEENYDEFLSEYKLKNLVKKYSDYIRYPIKMDVTKTDYPEDKDADPITYSETETLNSMIPLWRRNKSNIKEEEYNDFYKHQFNDYEEPMRVIHTKVEGLTTYTSLLFIPKHAPFDLYSEKYEKGLQLYSKGVFIMDKNKSLIPDYFRFVKGLVDSSDLSLNISREMLQHDRLLKKIASNVETKIKNELEKMLKNEREQYNEFYKIYGINLKYGIYEGFGMNKEKLQDLIMFKTTKSDEFKTLQEYIDDMREGQEHIYYASGKTKDSILALPQMDLIIDKDYEVLLFTDDIDEFMVNILMKYNDKTFKSINQGDLDLIDKKAQKKVDKLTKEKQSLLDALKEGLEGKVENVVLSKRLKDSPVCLVSGEGLSMEMEKVLQQLPNKPDAKAQRILEINPNHELFQTLESIHETAPENINKYATILYNQALLIEGLPLDNPVEFSNLMVELMIERNKNVS
ncbi:molecular chaperone HtpG [Candidatus Xianfuyuplasma coldseepsis]|uniref:Chaperone protein HtpG n=1 Tax=Candidatus Xianfuyuplasma coldseepsis TaxID=2782163 RepID=A0A7L7KNZ7_9MOLU|nr:molecular chaperone HtpG [Xianfuyuplasma coldseepsis]QMS84500.1 molecular chaperone HtpG [Xianfuyuplasma coldseepsis]